MKIGIFAFGRAGCRIAETFKQFENESMTHVTEFVYAFDTASEQLNSLSRIPEESRMLYGTHEFEGTGTGGLLTPATEASKSIQDKIKYSAAQVDTDEINAYIVIGSLGGGTGGAGAPVCAQTLSNEYPDTPVYGVGILPAMNEASVYIMNSAQTIQAFSKYTDNLLLFDNDKTGVSTPESNPAYDDDTDPDVVFGEVNQDIARCLHLLFTADEKKEYSHLTNSIIDTEEIIETLSTGGLSTFCYASETLPRAARPGVIGSFFEIIAYFKMKHKQKKYEKLKHESESSDDHVTDGNDLFTDEENVSVGSGPDSTVEVTSKGEVETQSRTIQTDDLPMNDAQSRVENGSTVDGSENEDPDFSYDWPHPTKLIPFTLDASSAMLDVDVNNASHGLQLLAGPKQHLSKESAVITNNWVNEHTNHKYTVTKNYPERGKNVAVLKLAAGVGIPERIKELQEEAKRISARVERLNEEKQSSDDPKRYNVFENQTDIPSSL